MTELMITNLINAGKQLLSDLSYSGAFIKPVITTRNLFIAKETGQKG